jgi:predicted ABC-type ATPase
VGRVMDRVRSGGHHVPAEIVMRRYRTGVRNLLNTYIPLANSWQVFDNSGSGPQPIALGKGAELTALSDADAWRKLKESCGD